MGAKTTVALDTVLKNRFTEICDKEYNLTAKEAIEILMKFTIDWGVNPDDLSSLWRKNPKRDIAEYHNYTVGFLKTFEKKQLEQFSSFENKQLVVLEKILESILGIASKNIVEKAVQNELLFTAQAIAKMINPKQGEALFILNTDNILAVEQQEMDRKKKK
jgi:antitoxin component of RelBE/YafQ-DinJ toxin-antitoxin module